VYNEARAHGQRLNLHTPQKMEETPAAHKVYLDEAGRDDVSQMNVERAPVERDDGEFGATEGLR
jgi:hypothetical protein